MAYESRLYIVKDDEELKYAEVIARFDCSRMDNKSWRELFSNPFDSNMYAEDGNTKITEDNYGEELKYAEFPKVILWLEREMEYNKYRRLKPLLSLMKGFDLSEWQDGRMKIVHFGY